MTRHLTDEQLLDVLEGDATAAGTGHAGECPACATRLAGLRDTLLRARRADVPEPSPLYWQAFRRSVDRRIAEEPRSRRAGWLVPLLATAALVAVVVARPPRGVAPGRPEPPAATATAVVPAWSALPPAEQDDSLPVLEAFALTDGEAAAWEDGRGLGVFEAGLSDEESQALADGLRQSKGGAR
jgi:hypothetical protein